MKILANENVPLAAVRAMRMAGHDVTWIAEDCPSTSDTAVLAIAIRESRLLVTLDKDFGELAFRHGLTTDCGIILLRVPANPSKITGVLLRAFEGPATFEGHFTVVEEDRIRSRTLRKSPKP